MSEARDKLRTTTRCVVKVGSALLTNDGRGLDRDMIASLARQIAAARTHGVAVVLVSSGAVAEGLSRMGATSRPRALHELQAMAAIGQMGLVQAYESAFQAHALHTAQVLLTHEDLTSRVRYLNARSTLRTLLDFGVVPVINENDTVATDEIRLGDNDTLGALVANLIEAELLVILTDQAGLHDKDPRAHADAKLVTSGASGDPALYAMAGDSGSLGRGGMRTKLLAAEKAARSGAATLIVSGREPDALTRSLAGEPLGTLLSPATGRTASRKRWLADHMQVRGKLTLDAGAIKVLRDSGRSLLPVGVTAVNGDFARGEVVACVDAEGHEIARGLVNYSSADSIRIIGRPSSDIEKLLGYVDEPELIHRDNMVIL